MLRKNGVSIEQLRAITTDFHTAGLTPEEVALMDYAQKIALQAYAITAEDVQKLKDLGLSDAEILDAALTAAARCFISKTIDALGIESDAAYAELQQQLADVLPATKVSAPAHS